MPPEVDKASAEVQMAIAFALEERNCIQAEMDLAARRCRQLVFAANTQALRAQQLFDKLGVATSDVVQAIQNVQTPHSDTIRPRCSNPG